jgi:hypothetical protein
MSFTHSLKTRKTVLELSPPSSPKPRLPGTIGIRFRVAVAFTQFCRPEGTESPAAWVTGKHEISPSRGDIALVISGGIQVGLSGSQRLFLQKAKDGKPIASPTVEICGRLLTMRSESPRPSRGRGQTTCKSGPKILKNPSNADRFHINLQTFEHESPD